MIYFMLQFFAFATLISYYILLKYYYVSMSCSSRSITNIIVLKQILFHLYLLVVNLPHVCSHSRG